MGKSDVIGVFWYIFPLVFCAFAFFFGITRISTGLIPALVEEPFTLHYVNVGLLYIKIASVVMIGLVIMLMYSLAKHRN